MRNVVLILLFSAITIFCSAQSSSQEGLATYYSSKFVGRKTSNGEIYRHTKLTGAHATLPFGTEVLVTNPANSKSVIVTINDRCSPKRIIIDLSKAAASKIDLIRAGTAMVRLDVVNDSIRQAYLAREINADSTVNADSAAVVASEPIGNGNFGIQVASVSGLKQAKTLIHKLEDKYDARAIYRKISRKGKKFYRVTLVGFETREDANLMLKKVKKKHPTAITISIK